MGLRLGDLRGSPRPAAVPRLGGRTCPRQSQLASQLLNFPSRALRPPLRQHPCLSIISAHPHPPLARGGRVVFLLCSPSQSVRQVAVRGEGGARGMCALLIPHGATNHLVTEYLDDARFCIILGYKSIYSEFQASFFTSPLVLPPLVHLHEYFFKPSLFELQSPPPPRQRTCLFFVPHLPPLF